RCLATALLLVSKPPPPPQTSPLSLHDALPISSDRREAPRSLSRLHDGGPSSPARRAPIGDRRSNSTGRRQYRGGPSLPRLRRDGDRKSTRLNSSHVKISYAVFCLKKKTSDTSP